MGSPCCSENVGERFLESLEQFLVYPIEQIPFVFVALMIAFTIHEFSHAYFAYKFGDPTAKDLGRVSLNPRVHLDVLGTILILIAGFGWAKPVPVDRSRFKNPRMMGVIVSAAGPLSNLVIAFIGLFIYYYLFFTLGLDPSESSGIDAVNVFLNILIGLNTILFIFNLIPLPPLDGYRIVEDLAPMPLRYKMMQNEQWGLFVFLLIVFIPPLSRVTIQPLFSFTNDIIYIMGNVIRSLIG